MATIDLNPSAELHWIAQQSRAWTATNFTFTDGEGIAIDLTGFVVEMRMRTTHGAAAVLEWLTSDGTVLIGGADNNVMTIGAKSATQMDVVSTGTYIYDIKVTGNDLQPVTYFEGTIRVEAPVS